MKTKIAIFEQNRNVLNCILGLLTMDPAIEIVGLFTDAVNCLEKTLACKADIILFDIEMPGLNGIEVVKSINSELPQVQILIQTALEKESEIFQCIKAGASGYLQKSSLRHTLLKGIHEMINGGAPMSSNVSRKVLKIIYGFPDVTPAQVSGANQYKLTPREREVLINIVNGLSHKMIAADMMIRYDTVRNHVKRIYEKLEVRSLTEVVAKAIYHQIV